MMLRHYFTVVDYPARQLRLAAYTAPTHIDADEFVGLGLDLAPFGDEWQVVSVYPGTDAGAKDVRVDDVVEEIAAVALRGQPSSFVEDQLAAYAVGQAVPLGIRHPGGQVEQKMILIEDLLPSYPPPP
jgi:hypothetical protein